MVDFGALFLSFCLRENAKQDFFFHLSYNIFPLCHEFSLEFFNSLDDNGNHNVFFFFPFRHNVALKLE